MMEVENLEQAPFVISATFDRIDHPPRGRDQGGPGAMGRLRLRSGPVLKGMGRQTVPAGDRLIVEFPGGGGFGDPLEREPELVAVDARRGLISLEVAARDYGVVVAALTFEVNQADTARLRAEMRAARLNGREKAGTLDERVGQLR